MSVSFSHERFEKWGDPELVVSERLTLWKFTRLWYKNINPRFSPKDDYWLLGIDQQTKQPVLIHPRGYAFAWKNDLAFETAARRVQELSLPGTVPVLHVGRGVVYAMPPPAPPRPTLPINAAAKYALDAAVITARLHAVGCGHFAFGPSNLRLIFKDGAWQMHWLIPGIVELDLLEALEQLDPNHRESESRHPRWHYDLEPIQSDLWQLCFFFFSLFSYRSESSPLSQLEPTQATALATLLLIRDEGPEAVGIHDAASLAQLFATLAGLSAAVPESLPTVRTLPRLYPDWDEVIAEGEAMLKTEKHYSASIKLPLAAAYHQRASRSWSRGALEAALDDVNQAIRHDSYPVYHTTRAVVLDAANRRDEARKAIAAAFDSIAAMPPSNPFHIQYTFGPDEQSRAHLARGMIAWRDGRLDEAEADLRRADELQSSPLTTRALSKLARRG
jgi:tetratricopeptide (TPR) repeat protein